LVAWTDSKQLGGVKNAGLEVEKVYGLFDDVEEGSTGFYFEPSGQWLAVSGYFIIYTRDND